MTTILIVNTSNQFNKNKSSREGKRFIWISPDEMMLLMMKFLEQIELPTTAKFPLVLP